MEKVSKIQIEDLEIVLEHETDLEDAHPRRSRAKNFGELIQMDACSQKRTNTIFAHLHLAIDNATGLIVGGYLHSKKLLLFIIRYSIKLLKIMAYLRSS